MSSDSDSYGPKSYKTCGYPHEKFVKALATLDERSANQSKQLDALGKKFDDTSESLHERITMVKESITAMGTDIAKEIGALKFQGNGVNATLVSVKEETERQKKNLDDEISVEIKDEVQAEMKRLKAEDEAKQREAGMAILRILARSWKVWAGIVVIVASGGGLVEVFNRLIALLMSALAGGGAGH